MNLTAEVKNFLNYVETIGFDKFRDDEEDIELLYDDIKIVLHLNKQRFDIFRDFCYPLNDYAEDFENEKRSVLQTRTEDCLLAYFNQAPETEPECGYGCPFDANLVGYFNKVLDAKFVADFIKICIMAENGIIQEDINTDILESLKEVLGEHYHLKDNALISIDGTISLFLKDTRNNKKFALDSCIDVDKYYYGLKGIFMKSNKSDIVVTIGTEIIGIIDKIEKRYNFEESFQYFSNFDNLVYATNGVLIIIVTSVRTDKSAVNLEFQSLQTKLFELRNFDPQIQIAELFFETLTPENFEHLCYDLLQCKGFLDVHPVGKTQAPDGGKDMIATERYPTCFGIETRKWLWQCKHSKNSLGRKDVSEINDLLQENKASCYGLFCSNFLTPDAIRRLEIKKQQLGGVVYYYGKRELETLIEEFPQLIKKYNLL